VGSVPGWLGACCHGDDEEAVYHELCKIVDEWTEIVKHDGLPLPAETAGNKTPIIRSNMMGLQERIESLPPDMQAQVAVFVEYLHHKKARQQAGAADKSLAPIKRLKGLGKEIWQDTIHSREAALDELAAQAQELDMGY